MSFNGYLILKVGWKKQYLFHGVKSKLVRSLFSCCLVVGEVVEGFLKYEQRIYIYIQTHISKLVLKSGYENLFVEGIPYG